MKKTILILATILLLTSCSKNDDTPATPQDQLPPITTIGANTAGCLINGQLLIPKNGSQAIGGSPNFGLMISAGNNFHPPTIGGDYFQVEIANKLDQNGSGIVLWIKNLSAGEGNYIVNQSNGEIDSLGPNNNQIIVGIRENGTRKTFFSSPNSGVIIITKFDYYGGIQSGIFFCNLYNKDNPTEKITITDGRFDIKVSTLNK
jgi:hypothetical protein